MQNLVTEVLQAAVGNHFRDKLQSLPAVRFIETRQEVQKEAFEHIRDQLTQYEVETKGVYIQDVVLPAQLVEVLTQREIANQRIETLRKQEQAESQRIAMEKAKGQADMQGQLATSEVQIAIKENNAKARKAEADGEAEYIQRTGTAKGAEVRAVGLARAEGYRAQVQALGALPTAVVNAITSLSDKNLRFVPEILVTGADGANAINGLAATLMRHLSQAKATSGSKEGNAAGKA
jgi:hypothetical protein